MSSTTSAFAIFDREIGLLQWLGRATTPRAALAALDADVGIDPAGLGLDEAARSFFAVELTTREWESFVLDGDCDIDMTGRELLAA